MIVKYKKTDKQDLTGQQSAAWLTYAQTVFSSVATSATIQGLIMYYVRPRVYAARVRLRLNGTASQYITAMAESKGAHLQSFDGTVAVWDETRVRPAYVNQYVIDLLSAVHPSIAPSSLRQLVLGRGSPNTSKIWHESTCTPEEWATAEAAGTPLGTFLKVV